ncbi:type II toxin-antitoxin system RelE/ParE family toxin [Sphingomonas sp.]|uniref:type II toxin-antitoxin system RelE/ParE family toxin n=1 Tax=Sphingomonas sp. TaxID=28214 RepID=UPI0025E54C8B|nr:type II toxin-antitoxin system RelE/ParE family toxin [Sphingomonas sp.]
MDNKKVEFLGSSYKDLLSMPEEIIDQFGYELGLVQNDMTPDGAKHLTRTFENGVWELRDSYDGDAYRAVYYLKHEEVVFILHCFKKKSTKGGEIPAADKTTIDARLAAAKLRIVQMKKDHGK